MIIVTMSSAELAEDPLGKSKLDHHEFIHASTLALFPRIIDKFIHQNNLFLVFIDETKLTSKLKYEDKNNNQLFYPHIYGYINHDSILKIEPLIIHEGKFIPPSWIAKGFE